MDLNIIGTCDFTDVNKEIQSVSQKIEGLERDLGELNFDEVKDKLTSALRVNPKMMGIEELKDGYLSLEQNIGTLDTVSAKYSATVSAYQTLVEDIRVKQRALNDEFVRAAAAQDDKTMIACRQALASLKAEYEGATAKLQAYQAQMAEVSRLSEQAGNRLDAFGAQIRANSLFEFEIRDMSQGLLEDRFLRLKEFAFDTKDSIAMLNEEIANTSSSIASMSGERAEKQAAIDSGTLDDKQTAEYQARIDDLTRSINLAEGKLNALNNTVQAHEHQLGLAEQALEKVDTAFAALGNVNPFDTKTKSVAELKDALEQANAEVERQTAAQASAQAEVERAQQRVREYQSLLGQTSDEWVRSGYLKNEEKAQQALDARVQKLQDVERELANAIALQRSYGDALQERTAKPANDAAPSGGTGIHKSADQFKQELGNYGTFNFDASSMGAEQLQEQIGLVVGAMRIAKDEMASLTEENEKLGQANQEASAKIAAAQTELGKVGNNSEKVAELNGIITEQNAIIDENNAKIAANDAEIQTMSSIVSDATNAEQTLNAALKDVGEVSPYDMAAFGAQELAETIKLLVGDIRENTTELSNTKKEIEDYQTKVETLKNVLDKGLSLNTAEDTRKLEEYKQKLEELNKTYHDTELTLAANKEQLKQLQAEEQKRAGASKPSGGGGDGLPDPEKTSALSKAFGDISKSMGQVTGGFKTMAQGGAGAAKGLGMVTAGVKGLGKAILANPILLAIAAVIAIIAVLVKSVKNFFTNTTEGADRFASIKGTIDGVRAAIEAFIANVGRKIGEFLTSFSALGKVLAETWNGVKQWASNVWHNVGQWLANMIEGLGKWFKGLGKAIKSFFAGEGFDTSGMKGAFDNMKDGMRELGGEWDDLKKAAEEYKKTFSDWDMKSLNEYIEGYKKIAELERQLAKSTFGSKKTIASLDAQKSELQETMYSGGQLQQLEAMDKMRGIINQKYATEISLAQQELNIQRQKNALAGKDVTVDQLKAQQDLEIKLLNLQTQRNGEIRSMARRYKSVTDALYNQRKAYEKELTKLEEEGAKAGRNAQHDEAIRALEFQKKYAMDINQQLELQAKLREENLKKTIEQLEAEKKIALAQIEEDKKTNIRKTYGEDALKKYENGEQIADSEGVVAFYDKKSAQTASNFDQKIDIATRQSEQKGAFDDMSADIDAYTKYVEQIVDLENWKAEQLQAIRDGESALTQEQVEDVYNQQKEQLKTESGIDDTESAAADISAHLTAALSTAVWENIQQIGAEALQQLDEQISAIEKTKNAAVAELGQQASTDENGEPVDPTGIYAEIAAAEEELAAGKEGAQATLNALKEKEKALTAQIQGADASLIKLGKQRKNVQSQINADLKRGTTQTKKMTKEQKWDTVARSLGAAEQALDALANTMGGALSKKSKKAIESMKTVVSFATQNITAIKEIVQFSTKAMEATAAGAATAISTVEKASVILTIISLAIQAIQAIVNIAMKYSESQKMQDAIDAQLEKVEELKRQNAELQRQYQSETGIDYYKGLAKAAQDYNQIIKEQQEALRQAQELQARQEGKYGEDSDKAKDAKDQTNEIEDGLHDLEDEQAELMQQLRDDLLTTDLHSFSENLADSLIEGFENGKEGISDTWNDMLNDLLTSMMKKQLAMQLEKQFEGVFDKMNSMVDTDGVLSQSEINEIVDLMNGASAGAQQIAEAYYDLMDEMGLLTDSDEAGSKGGFESMSQDTADELNARFTALQITGANMDATMQTMSQAIIELNVSDKLKMTILQTLQENIIMGVQTAQNQLDELRIIADNTGMLNETNRRLKAIEQHTAKL